MYVKADSVGKLRQLAHDNLPSLLCTFAEIKGIRDDDGGLGGRQIKNESNHIVLRALHI